MSLIHLIYTSQAAVSFTPRQLGVLTLGSARRNIQMNISGALLLGDGCLVQLLEGPEEAVDDLFEKIAGDRRHREVRQLCRQPMSRRLFGQHAMSSFHEDLACFLDQVKLRKLTQRINGDDKAESLGQDAIRLLTDLTEAIEQQTARAVFKQAA